MFIYVGLMAAIILSSQPANVRMEARLQTVDLPIISNAPLQRNDI